MSLHSTEASEEKETGRIEAFSDGVFSIAITLLVLELKVPRLNQLNDETLLKALAQLWPSYLAFFISFFTILIMWVNHHRLFTHIKRTDNTFLFLNGLLLMIVSFVPFPTALLAEHVRYQYAVTATAVYTGTYVLIGLAFNALWHYAIYKRRLLGRAANMTIVRKITISYLFGPPLFLLTFILAFFNVGASLAALTTIVIFYALTVERKNHENSK